MPPVPKGCDEWTEERGYKICRIHYSADLSKTPEWAAKKKAEAPSESNYRQEYEIDHFAGSGALFLPEFDRAIHVEPPFPIPHAWTRYMGIDPHKRRPHAFLWMAVSPWGDHYYYREYWPSRIYGKKGKTPEDDRLYKIDDYVLSLKYLEGSEISHFASGGFADNQGKAERIRFRVQDTHGKAIFASTTSGKDDPETFWDRYDKLGIHCIEATKDVGSGRDVVGQRLRPRKVMTPSGEKQEAIIHIFETLPELIYEARTARFPALTPSQAEVRDPVEDPLKKRVHILDLVRYIEMLDPTYVPEVHPASVEPLTDGVSY